MSIDSLLYPVPTLEWENSNVQGLLRYCGQVNDVRMHLTRDQYKGHIEFFIDRTSRVLENRLGESGWDDDVVELVEKIDQFKEESRDFLDGQNWSNFVQEHLPAGVEYSPETIHVLLRGTSGFRDNNDLYIQTTDDPEFEISWDTNELSPPGDSTVPMNRDTVSPWDVPLMDDGDMGNWVMDYLFENSITSLPTAESLLEQVSSIESPARIIHVLKRCIEFLYEFFRDQETLVISGGVDDNEGLCRAYELAKMIRETFEDAETASVSWHSLLDNLLGTPSGSVGLIVRYPFHVKFEMIEQEDGYAYTPDFSSLSRRQQARKERTRLETESSDLTFSDPHVQDSEPVTQDDIEQRFNKLENELDKLKSQLWRVQESTSQVDLIMDYLDEGK